MTALTSLLMKKAEAVSLVEGKVDPLQSAYQTG